MGYTAWFSNSLEKLASLYSGKVSGRTLFGNRSIVIVQNKNMAEWLKLELASANRYCCAVNFMYPDEAIKTILDFFPSVSITLEKKNIVHLDDLKIIIYRELENIFLQINNFPQFVNLKKYIDNVYQGNMNDEKMTDEKGQRLYALSDTIAGFFYHYGSNCFDMTSCWEKEKSFPELEKCPWLKEHEKWQMILWNKIFSKDSSYVHMGQIIGDILSGVLSTEQEIKKDTIPEIDIFGSSFLSEQAVSFFSWLAEKYGADVNHYILSPSPFRENDKGASCFESVKKWSSIATGLASILKKENVTVKEMYDKPESKTLLDKLKKHIYYNSKEQFDSIHSSICNTDVSDPADGERCGDTSVEIISAAGKKREIEILKDKILEFMSRNKYKFRHIGVAAPDINSYVPFIESVFPDFDNSLLNIPYNIMDINYAHHSPFIKGFMDLVSLCGARFTRKELFTVFFNPCFAEKFNLSEKSTEEWLGLCDNLFIKWGVDERHRKDVLSYNDGCGTWKASAERIAAGLVYDDTKGVVTMTSGRTVLPASVGNRDIFLMFMIVESLYNDLYFLKGKKDKLSGWTSYFEKIMDRYLAPEKETSQDKDRSYLKTVFRKINSLGATETDNYRKELNNVEIPFSVFKIVLEEFAQETGHCKGQYLSDGVCFSSIKPLRAVPFKAIFLLGMDMEVFPGKEKQVSFDLRTVIPQSIDLSKQNTDSFAFLETILSAKEKLVISWSGINSVTGEDIELSPIVSDLEEIIGTDEAKKVKKKYPVLPYSKRCFTGENINGAIPSDIAKSYDIKNLELAKILAEEQRKKSSFPLFPEKDDSALCESFSAPVSSIVKFLKTPLEFYMENRIGLAKNILDLPEEDVSESLGFNNLDKIIAGRILSETDEGNPQLDSFISNLYDREVYQGKKGRINVVKGEFSFLAKEKESFYLSLLNKGYFDFKKCSLFFGKVNPYRDDKIMGDDGNIYLPTVILKSDLGQLEISGTIYSLRREERNFYGILSGNNSLKNIVPHLFYYVILSFLDVCDTYTLIDCDGNQVAIYPCESEINVEEAVIALSNAFLENLQHPYLVDCKCLEYSLKNYKKIGNENISTGEIIKLMKNYYEENDFFDTSLLKSFDNIAVSFESPIFIRLLEKFYFYIPV